MIYPDLQFPHRDDRPFFYSNFVTTLDGKVQVTEKSAGYWPIGSDLDYQTLIELRTHADVLIHGRKTATWVRTLDRLGSSEFQKARQALGKTDPILYVVVSAHPNEELIKFLEEPPAGTSALLVVPESASLPTVLEKTVSTIRLGKDTVPSPDLADYLHRQKKEIVLLEGGPQLLYSFTAANLLDEVFLTLAPKIFAGDGSTSLTMVNGPVFPPDEIKKFHLRSTIQVEDELYLRYARHTA